MRILITFVHLKGRSGGELYVYELALQLLRMGLTPIIFTGKETGPLYAEIQSKGIPITTELETIAEAPDIIIGNSQEELLLALLYFPKTPSIFIMHDRFQFYSIPLKLKRVYRYITVSRNYFDALIFERGIPAQKVINIPNSVDFSKFKSRLPLPKTPKKAAIFSNHATFNGYATFVRQACDNLGISLDIIGKGVNNLVHHPEEILPNYDLVFAKGRSALEALGIGCAVILYDIEGLGPMVSRNNIELLRQSNLGWRLLQNQITVENIHNEILKYDAHDAEAVAAFLKEEASLIKMTARIVEACETVINQHRQAKPSSAREELAELYQYLKTKGIYGCFFQLHERMDELHKLIHEQKQQITQLNVQLELKNSAHKMDIDRFTQSYSWKITKPFRKLNKFFKLIIPTRVFVTPNKKRWARNDELARRNNTQSL